MSDSGKQMFRIGQGFDIHRLAADHPLIIGGVTVESPLGSVAHSDGDVLLHALIDALLGAAALGDIGDHFPPDDDTYKDADSAALLEAVMAKLSKAGFAVCNIDSTVFLEKPKMKPYKDSIRKRVAVLTGIDVNQVSFKAKTAEKLGAIGHREAIAASATVLVTSS